MKLIVTEKNIAAQKIASLLSDTKPKSDKVYNTPIYRFEIAGEDCVTVGLKGHIEEVTFPDELKYSTRRGWVGITPDGETVKAQIPRSFEKPPWSTKRKPWIEDGVALKTWKIPALPYLCYAPIIKVPKEKEIIRSLKSLAKKADSAIIATDFDREGELIGMDALNIIKDANPDIPIKRARYSALIKSEIEHAFNPDNLHELNYNLAYAGEARQHIDLVWGAVLTRFLTLAKYSGFNNPRSAGRVQTPTLALIVAREKERKAHVPVDYWQISAKFSNDANANEDERFSGIYEKEKIHEESKANAIFDAIKGEKSGQVASVEVKKAESKPPAPFNTTSLMAAASSLGLKPARTMRIAESLYMNGLISYPRVDNTVYPSGLDFVATLKMLSKNTLYAPVANELLSKDNFTPTRGKQQTTDHPPIHPTAYADSDSLSAEEWKLYNLIARRFIATLCDSAIIERTRIIAKVAGQNFKIKGDVIAYAGYRSIYQYGLKKEEQLPHFEIGDTIYIFDQKNEKLQTQPPARYSTGKLIQEMEKEGLGTKATRHDTIERLYSRKYIQNDPIEPTQLGEAIIDALNLYSPTITTSDMTAELENEMSAIAEGKDERDNVVNHSKKILEKAVNNLIPKQEEVADVIAEASLADARVGTCPECGGDLVLKSSPKQHSNFVGCNNWPDCENIYPLPQGMYESVDEVCEHCGTPQIKITPFRAKAYIHCLNPKCTTNVMEDLEVGECKKCKEMGKTSKLFAKKNPRTLKRFINCENMEECETSYPLPPRGDLEATFEYCETCGAPEIIVHTARGPWRICPNLSCPSKEKDKNSKKK